MIEKIKYCVFLFLFCFVNPLNAQVEELATGFLQPEGPVWKITLLEGELVEARCKYANHIL